MVACRALCRRCREGQNRPTTNRMFCWRPIAKLASYSSPLSKYEKFNTRICRPIGLAGNERIKVIDYALARVGMQYDNKQILDLARYLFPYPPVPVFFAAAHAGDRQRRSDPGDLLNAYRGSIRVNSLSHPCRKASRVPVTELRPSFRAKPSIFASMVFIRRGISTSRRILP